MTAVARPAREDVGVPEVRGRAPSGPDVLVVLPDSARTTTNATGAALVRWARDHAARPPRAAALRGGPLKAELRASGVVVLESPRQPLRTVENALLRLRRPREAAAVRKVLHRILFTRPPHPDVVLALGAGAAGPAARNLRNGERLVSYLDERPAALEGRVDPATWAQVLRATGAWVVADAVVADDLAALGVPRDAIATVPPFLDPPRRADAGADGLRRSLGLRPGEVVVGGVGRSDWSDGPDVFLRTAAVLRRREPDLPARFVWVGAPEDGPSRWILDHDVRRAGLGDVVTFTGSLDDAHRWVGALDLLLVPGRTAALPATALQAATAGVPVVGFATAGLEGLAAEAGGPPAVDLAPHLDVAALAAAVGRAVRRAMAGAGEGRGTPGALGHRLTAHAAPRLWQAVLDASGAGAPADLEGWRGR